MERLSQKDIEIIRNRIKVFFNRQNIEPTQEQIENVVNRVSTSLIDSIVRNGVNNIEVIKEIYDLVLGRDLISKHREENLKGDFLFGEINSEKCMPF